MRKLIWTAFAVPCFLAAQSEAGIRLVRAASGLTNPVDMQSARDGSNRLFIVQQNGVIRILRDGSLVAAPFLDIRTKTRTAGECGLLGLAFPPDFSAKDHFYVNYTNPGCTMSTVARYRLTAPGADTADAASEEIVLTLSQPFPNHNGGGLAFGPDGFLYVGFGDGGSGGDPQNNGQKPDSLLGKMLRIGVESGGRRPYDVPTSNPFFDDGRHRSEIWATGLRNPWRFSFDRETGDLWIADVGQSRAEEINFQAASSKGGENYGWRLMEGMACYNPANCDRTGLTLPVHEYTRSQGDVSVTGGYVYRGNRWPSLRGTYVYGDYESGRIWGLRREGPLFNNRLLLDSTLNVSAFGQDESGELYVAHHGAGEIFRIEAAQSPSFSSRSVTNAASFEVGMVPGSAAVVFAGGVRSEPGISAARALPLPRVLDGVEVLVNGRAAPLFAIANQNGQEQVNFQVPWETEGPPAQVVVRRDGQASPSVDVAVQTLQPGIFESNNGEAIVVRAADNTLVAAQRPLRPGESVYFYAAGLGPVDANPGTGNGGPRSPLARARTPVSVTLDGLDCDVRFAGLAPDFVGVYQVNVRVPAGLRPGGGARELVIAAGTQRSKPARISVE